MAGTDERICIDGSEVVCDGKCESCLKLNLFSGESMAIQKMGLYEAWMQKVTKTVIALVIVFGLLIASVVYMIIFI